VKASIIKAKEVKVSDTVKIEGPMQGFLLPAECSFNESRAGKGSHGGEFRERTLGL